MTIISDPESVARYYEMDRLSREHARAMSPAERDRRMQANRATAMTPQQRFKMLDRLIRSAARLKGYTRCDDARTGD